MTSHTSNLYVTIQTIEVIDRFIKILLHKTFETNVTLVITAGHDNAEKMLDNDKKLCKSHTTNQVPFTLIQKKYLYTK